MLRILFIDDESAKIRRYRELVEEMPALNEEFVEVATNYQTAIEKLAACQYDLAVLDLYLPLRDGDDPSPENAVKLLNDLQDDDDLKMPYSIVGITRRADAPEEYRQLFDQLLLAYIYYEQNSDDWKRKLKNKIEFLLKAQRSLQYQEIYDYDVAIVNALMSENDHVLRQLGSEGWKEEKIPADESTTYYTTAHRLSDGRIIRIVTCYALHMASTASAMLATKVIFNFRPRYLFMSGIAAAVDRQEVNLGDIMIAECVWDGASGKIKTDNNGVDIFMPDYRQLPLDADMLKLAKRLSTDKKLLSEIENSYQYPQGKPDTRLRLHVGPMASVPAVLSSKTNVEEIQRHCRKLLGIEMEGYGLFYAAHNSIHPRPQYTMLIKSVSDFADSEKSDNYQDYCMHTSAYLVKHIIENELNYRRS